MIRCRLAGFALVAFGGMIACGGDDSGGSGTTDDTSSTGDPHGTSGAGTDADASTAVDDTATDDTTTSVSTNASSDDTHDSSSESSTGGHDGIVLGEVCPLLERVGQVTLYRAGGIVSVYGRVFDGTDPWIGAPELATDTCEYHRFLPASCGTCDPGEVCHVDGDCVPQRRAHTDAVLDVTIAGMQTSYSADAITGEFFGELDDAGDELALHLAFAGLEIEIPAFAFAEALPDLQVIATGDSCDPMSMDGEWTPRDDGSRVRTVIPINHHAQGPTFTYCDVPAQAGGFSATADMLLPLAVITCLEFQGLDVMQTAAAYTELGCVEFRAGVQVLDPLVWQ